jgi:hypothetical protein
MGGVTVFVGVVRVGTEVRTTMTVGEGLLVGAEALVGTMGGERAVEVSSALERVEQAARPVSSAENARDQRREAKILLPDR